jgi:hypothetical protein
MSGKARCQHRFARLRRPGGEDRAVAEFCAAVQDAVNVAAFPSPARGEPGRDVEVHDAIADRRHRLPGIRCLPRTADESRAVQDCVADASRYPRKAPRVRFPDPSLTSAGGDAAADRGGFPVARRREPGQRWPGFLFSTC